MMIYITKQQYLDWINSKTENFKYYTPAPYINQEKDPETGQPIDNRKQFPVLAMGVRADSTNETEYSVWEFENINEAGFNVILGSWQSKDIIGGSLQNAIAANVKLLFKNWGFQDGADEDGNYSKLMDKINDEDNRLGFGGNDTLRDEPTYKDIIGEDSTLNDGSLKGDALWKEYYYMMKPDPDYLVYLNVAAGGEHYLEGISGSSDKERYRKYLEAFQNYFKPSLFSYDGYPIEEVVNLIYEGMTDDEGRPLYRNVAEGKIIVDSDGYYNRLGMFNEISSDNERPFYAFCQSVNLLHLNSNKYRPVALEQYLRYEAFSALAFGAKGIVYWKYAPGDNTDSEAYISALLNWRGNKTASWYFAQKVNNEIQKYKDIFLHGDFLEQTICSYYSFNLNIYTRFKIVSEDNTDMIISRVSLGSNMYFIVVNTDPLRYHDITVNISTGTGVELTPVSSTSQNAAHLLKGNNTRIMIPGGYRIFYNTKDE